MIYSLTASNCLENKPANLGGFINQALPGKVLTIEEQCLARGGKPCVVSYIYLYYYTYLPICNLSEKFIIGMFF